MQQQSATARFAWMYAVAAAVGGFGAEATDGSAESTNHLTVARIPNGAIVEREVAMDFLQSNRFEGSSCNMGLCCRPGNSENSPPGKLVPMRCS